MLDRYSKYLKKGAVFIVRMWNGSDKYKPTADIIESNFEVVDRYLSDEPKAVVIVFSAGVSAQARACRGEPAYRRDRGKSLNNDA